MQTTDEDIAPELLLAGAVQAAREAGRVLLEYARTGFQIEHKNTIDLVTDADRAAERCIVDFVRARYPSHRILAEEQGVAAHSASPYQWIIDPLDGTTNFAHGLPVYSVSIAVERDGECIIGVVFDPTRDELFTAERGRGAYLNAGPIRVSGVDRLDHALLVTGFAYDVRDTPNNNLDHFSRFALRAQGVRRTGSAALDLCYVAAGRFDGFWEVKLHPWDMAAGCVILRESGGTVTDFSGVRFSIYGKELVASNGRIHQSMLSVLQAGAHQGGSARPSSAPDG
ncbi:MAG TPA: inositol monophosphatase family protein [Nitrospira sp.]|nr:inositol monophosphatase family protein [Nitrospira sp.]